MTAVSSRHAFTSSASQTTDARKVDAPKWNADHVYNGGSRGDVLIRDTTVATIGAAWQAKPFYDVRDYGAVGDGVTDDAAAIHLARTAAGTNGAVHFPVGTYLCGSGLVASVAGQTWYAQGGATIKKGFNGDLVTITATDVTLQGLILDGNTASYTGYGVKWDTTTRPRVRACTIKNTRSAGIFSGVTTGGRIDGNLFTGLASSALLITNGTTDVVIQGNRIDVPSTAANDSDAIQMYSGVGGAAVRDITISGNVISIGQAQSFGIEFGAFSGATMTDIAVVGNTIRMTGTCYGGISAGSTAVGVTLTGNTIDTNGQTLTIGAIELADVSFSSVTGNAIIGGSGLAFGIAVNRANDCVFANNAISSLSTTGAAIYIGASVAADCSRNLITGNRITLPATGTPIAIRLQSNHASATVDDNLITNNVIFGGANTVGTGVNISQDAGNLRRSIVMSNLIRTIGTAVSMGGVSSEYIFNHISNVNVSFGGSNTNQRRWEHAGPRYMATTSETVGLLVGSGSPEGVYAASPGAVFLRTDGGAATSLYVKESGTGSAGWVGK